MEAKEFLSSSEFEIGAKLGFLGSTNWLKLTNFEGIDLNKLIVKIRSILSQFEYRKLNFKGYVKLDKVFLLNVVEFQTTDKKGIVYVESNGGNARLEDLIYFDKIESISISIK